MHKALVASTLVLALSVSAVVSHAQSPAGPAPSLSLRGGGAMVAAADGFGRTIACGGSVSDGAGFCAAIVEGGKLFMWGEGGSGALGAADGSTEQQSTPALVTGLGFETVASVACGGKHCAAITDCGKVYTWGTGFCGQLGHGNGESKAAPTLVEGLAGVAMKEVSCGETHNVALSADGSVYVWGLDVEGQLGLGPSGHRAAPAQVGGPLAEQKATAVSCSIGPGGPGHSAAIASDGNLYTWGMGRDGQLGHGDTEPRLEPTLVSALADKTVVAVSCGATHTAALTDEGRVYTWGGGVSGQLGHGDKLQQLEPTLVAGVLEHKKVVAVSCGGFHTMVLLKDGSVFSWGEGLNGQVPFPPALLLPHRPPPPECQERETSARCRQQRDTHMHQALSPFLPKTKCFALCTCCADTARGTARAQAQQLVL
jgi:alpha-tubulin suppressor-like RCC1 family protein